MTAFALDRLDEERGGGGADRARERIGVAVRHLPETRRERSEAVAILRLGRKADDRDRAAVEVAGADDDLGAVGGNALDLVAPFARGLERGLDGFGAAVRGKRAIEAGDFGEPLQQRRQKLVVEDAGRDGEPLRLLDERAHDARMRVAVAHRRIRAHHVEIAATVLVPEPAAVAVREHDGQRIVVAGGVAALAGDRGGTAEPGDRSRCRREARRKRPGWKRR